MPRPINEQVVVITGASSGIGRETAIQFGKQGATVVLAARNQVALQVAAHEVEHAGGTAYVVPTDVAEWSQVEHLASEAYARFGHIDTWVNNASIAEYAMFEQITIDELDRVLQVNLHGVMYGVKAVLPYMKRQGSGTIINVSSGLGVRSVPLQSLYCASKHGVKGFTEALRMELDYEKSGIAVTLILPSSINTPFFNHARSKMGVRPQPIPPVYEPKLVADSIVLAATERRRDIYVGGIAAVLAALQSLSPGLLDKFMLFDGQMIKQQQTDKPDTGKDNLFKPLSDVGRVTGDFAHLSIKDSPYTRIFELHPSRAQALGAGLLALGLVAFLRRTR